MTKKTNVFIEKAIKIHQNIYNYILVEYKNSKEKIKIICPIHGEFEQTPDKHLSGSGCIKCGWKKTSINLKYDVTKFTEKSNIIHNNKYDYSLIKTYDNEICGKIICPVHGEFEQRLSYHLKKRGCPKCSKEISINKKKLPSNKFIERSNIIHNNKYDYSLVEYKNSKEKIKIICPIHGEFEQRASNHLNGQGCKQCANDNLSKIKTSTNNSFIEKALEIHHNKYSYENIKYIDNVSTLKIVCPIHGEFEQKPREHLRGKGCSKCTNIISKPQIDIVNILKDFEIDNIIENNREIINPYELDIYLPEYNLAIEYHGLYWHSTKFIDKHYHLNKFKICDKKGIRLIQIFEDEWINNNGIVLSKLKHILKKNDSKSVYARKTKIKTIDSDIFNTFLNMYHIQGKMNCKIKYGLYYEDELVSVIGFRNDKRGWDLNRFASKYHVIGGFSKLLKHFIRENNTNKIFTFADLRYTDRYNNVYLKNGFKEVNITKPNYFYIKGDQKRYSRVQFQKHKLKHKLKKFDEKLTEIENMRNNGWYRIFDCGNIKYELK